MKLSTIGTIFRVALAGFWVLLLADALTPGEAHWAMSALGTLCVYVFVSAHFYTLGAKRAAKTTTNEKSN